MENTKCKIIHIIGRSPAKSAYIELNNPEVPLPNNFVEIPTHPYWVGFFEGDFYVKVARAIMGATNRYKNECWQPYIGADREYTRMIKGIKHRIFPSKPPIKIKLNRDIIFRVERSLSLLQALKEEISKGNVILHFHGFPGGHNEWLLKNLDLSGTPAVVQHRGSSFKFEKYKQSRRSLISRSLYFYHWFFAFIFQKSYYKKIDKFLMGSVFVGDIIKEMGFKDVLLHKDGVDFDLFTLGSKALVKKELGLSQDVKILLYVGRFYKKKHVDKLLNVHKLLNKEMQIKLILIGGSESDELYQMAKDSSAITIDRLDTHKPECKELLIKYYQASDVYILISTAYTARCGGFGTAPVEALACGTPIVGNNLQHFPGSKDELKHLGALCKTEENVIKESIVKVLSNLESYSRCREIAKKYYDINITIQQNLEVYGELFQKYYGK